MHTGPCFQDRNTTSHARRPMYRPAVPEKVKGSSYPILHFALPVPHPLWLPGEGFGVPKEPHPIWPLDEGFGVPQEPLRRSGASSGYAASPGYGASLGHDSASGSDAASGSGAASGYDATSGHGAASGHGASKGAGVRPEGRHTEAPGVGGCLTGAPRVEGRLAQLAVARGVGVELPRLPETGVPREGGRVTAAGPGLHGSPLFHAWIQSLIPALLVVRVDVRTFCRTDPRSTTSSKSMRRASSRPSGSGLSHNSKRAGFTHSSTAHLRAKMSLRKGLGGFRQRMARSRMPAKPHRVERSRIEDHSSKVRSSRVLKFLGKK